MCGVTEREAFCEASDKLCSQSRAGSGVISSVYEGEKHKLCSQDRLSVYTSALPGFLQPDRTRDGWSLRASKKILREPGCNLCHNSMVAAVPKGPIVPIPRNQNVRIILFHGEKMLFAPLSNFMSQAWKHDPVIKPPGLSIRNNHETNVYVRASRSRTGAGQTHLSCASANPALGYLVLFRPEETRRRFQVVV